jgi:hypothetical protein
MIKKVAIDPEEAGDLIRLQIEISSFEKCMAWANTPEERARWRESFVEAKIKHEKFWEGIARKYEMTEALEPGATLNVSIKGNWVWMELPSVEEGEKNE